MNFIKKWYTYQKERFPVIVYGTYMLAVVFATFCVTSFAKSATNLNWIKIIPMFVCAFLQFFMIRIVDEFKDYKEDCKFRPYRPVPRGLVTLKELGVLFVICALTQLVISIVFNNIIPLAAVWIFFIIMSMGYFMKKIVDKHLLLEVTLDEILMPLLIIYLMGFMDTRAIIPSEAVYIFLIVTYVIAWIVEVARKIRCKEDEENGVRTYTALLGINKATMLLWFLELVLSILQAVLLGVKFIYIPIIELVVVSASNLLFMKKQNKKMAKFAELLANIYIMVVYVSMWLLLV